MPVQNNICSDNNEFRNDMMGIAALNPSGCFRCSR